MDEKELLMEWLQESPWNQEAVLEALHYVSEVIFEGNPKDMEGIDNPSDTYNRINILKDRCGYTTFELNEKG